jgi:curved DNA-binding protein CbpA
MTAKNPLELIGQIDAHPVAETVLEISQAKLTGSLRIERGETKGIIYFQRGNAIYAVSNQRTHRLGRVFISEKVVDEAFLLKHRQITNDLQLADAVVDELLIPREVVAELTRKLCVAVITDLIGWSDGQWTFSPNSRVKEGISFDIDVPQLLIDHARALPDGRVAKRLSDPGDTFTLGKPASELQLEPHEAFLVSRFQTDTLTLAELLVVSGLSESETKRLVYLLWMRGVLVRREWKSAITDDYLGAVSTIQFRRRDLIQEKAAPPKRERVIHQKPVQLEELAAAEPIKFDLEETLKRIESAWNHYQVLGIEPSAKMDAIRKSYFGLAKFLHPDRFRREAPELARRVELAFTELALAHETLKTDEGRQSYDMKMRELEKEKALENADGPVTHQESRAAVEFERGFSLQLSGDLEGAIPYLARAVHYAPASARYHAYYGKALSADDGQRLKAQNELLTAVKLEPGNAAFRLLLAEFYVRYKLLKRAEGELVRLLEMAPDNTEARSLLDTVRAKSLN